MDATVIGVDAHKRSHTAVVLDNDEQISNQLRLVADRRQTDRLLAWAARWPDRIFAIENARGLGRLLAQQLVGRGETVVDVPGRLTARTRRLSGHSARKSDEFDARSVAIVGANHTSLRRVELDDTPAELRVLLDRRWHLVSARHRVICRFHDRITELTAGGANKALSPTAAAKALRSIRTDNPADAARRQAAKDLLAEWRWLTRRINDAQRRLDQAVAMHGTTLTDIDGIGTTSAAAIVAIVEDPTRFLTRGHFASYNGTAPVDASSGDHDRHRLNRRGNRQLNKVIHTAAITQIRRDGPGRDYYERKLAEGKKHLEALRCLKRQLSDVIYRRMLADHRHMQTVRDGQMGTRPKAA
ncbi:IS110 family transposase [Salsipaludibacter albus]|uniref:IS110 family transposase n=1 Tax=Salsipaludibacter albus TaxID=2849650 RepID=UPI001EE3DEF9|nr:IS110 family transposase [Salsipaludibacter albus]MBY5163151.1 IS110 family transposase [Salsipaludibacter albus]